MLFFEKYIIIDPILDPQGVSLFVRNEFSNPVNGRFRVFFCLWALYKITYNTFKYGFKSASTRA